MLGLYRTTSSQVELHGVTIPRKAKVMLLNAAANRDPRVFRDPDTFRLDRPAAELRRHLSFGLGVHFCLGSPLARLEGHSALATLLDRAPVLRLHDPGERIAPWFLWGRRKLHLAR